VTEAESAEKPRKSALFHKEKSSKKERGTALWKRGKRDEPAFPSFPQGLLPETERDHRGENPNQKGRRSIDRIIDVKR
jgi:hypothetical protein